ncbi:MAG: hypothetical protein LIO65_00910, partial [Odoribacter sp.]|nr:hypothetical protein [Odoribacter sp.]
MIEMGLYKGIATKAKNNGYYDSDKWICEDHFKDKYAKQFIQENGEMHACDFCDNGASSKI